MKDFMQEYIKTTAGNAEKLVSDAEVKCVFFTSHSPRGTELRRTVGLTFHSPCALCRYVMAVADSFGDGEVEEEEMARAVAIWQALLNDQEMIACEPRSPPTQSGTLECSDTEPVRSRSTLRCL